MADISQYTQQIRKAVYGRDVREAIAAGIETVNENSLEIGENAKDAVIDKINGSKNLIVVDDNYDDKLIATVEKTDIPTPYSSSSDPMTTQKLVFANKNLYTGSSTIEFTQEEGKNKNWSFQIKFDDILPVGKYILSFNFKGWLPDLHDVSDYEYYDESSRSWKLKMLNMTVPVVDDTYTETFVECIIDVIEPRLSCTYKFSMKSNHVGETSYVSNIMLRPESIRDNTYEEAVSTSYTVDNSEDAEPIEMTLRSGTNVIYCGTGSVDYSYNARKYANDSEFKTRLSDLQKKHNSDIANMLVEIAKIGYEGTGSGSVILGTPNSNEVSGGHSIAHGHNTKATGANSHSEGNATSAEGANSHAEGYGTRAAGDYSHSEGLTAKAIGQSSHAEGQYTIARGRSQHAFGEYNAEGDTVPGSAATRGKYIETVGNGQDASHRSNARTLDWNGNEELAGNLTLGKGTADEVTITAAQLKALLAMLT